MEQARAAHRQGQWPAAQSICAQVLRTDAECFDALFLLGIMARERNAPAEAEIWMNKALKTNPASAPAYRNRGLARRDLKRWKDARDDFDRALALDPGYAEAYLSRGNLCAELRQWEEALCNYEQAIARKTGFAQAYYNRAVALADCGRLEESLASYDEAIRMSPAYPEAHLNRGFVCARLGKYEEALASHDRAISLRPRFAEAHANRACALAELGRFEEGLVSIDYAIALKPDRAQWHSDRASLLRGVSRMPEALASCDRAVELQPDHVMAHLNRGAILSDLGCFSGALQSLQQALAFNPECVEAHNNVGGVFLGLGQLDEAQASYQRALQIEPQYAPAHSNLLMSLLYPSGVSNEEIFEAHREFEARFGAPAQGRPTRAVRAHEGTKRRLKVGYLSPDFRQHSVANFIWPLLREHDRETVEMFCYAEVAQPDEVTAMLQGRADHWLSTLGLPDEVLAERIGADEIDILVDLAGHTSGNRLPVFAFKPAPVQISWLGYPDTTGLSAMDYRLVDAVTDPAGEADRWASERLIRLEDGFLCFEPPALAPLPAIPPCLERGVVTFGSFNNPAKLSRAMLEAWGELLGRVPRARLLLKGKGFDDAGTRAGFLARFRDCGGDEGRVSLIGHVADLAHHLMLYEQVDVALDPFPYNGTTTTCEALWMGVPTVTLRGTRHAARVGASLLTQVGLEELIAPSVAAYIEIAADLTALPERLSTLRRTMRERMLTSPLCDAPRFARKIEATYRALRQRGREI